MKECAPDMIDAPPRLIVCGAPASGKGEQCQRIIAKYGLVHVTTADATRSAITGNTELGAQAKECQLAGAPLPDDLLAKIVVESLASPACEEQGWLLDGFPRNQAQAEALRDAGVTPSALLALDCPDSVLLAKCVNRRFDPATGTFYDTVTNPPPEGEVAERVIQRPDDREEVVAARIANYHEQVEGVASVFPDALRTVDADRALDSVFEEACARIDGAPIPARVVLLGAPASGKGEACKHVLNKYGVEHVTPASILRFFAKEETERGTEAKACMERTLSGESA